MISSTFHLIIYQPLYNALIWLVDRMPMHDMGLAVIVLTIAVRVIIYPLSRRAIESQKKMKELAPEIERLKEKHKDDPQEQSRAMFALYRERDVKPFASFGLLLVQIPIFLALYWIFARAGLPAVDDSLLYAFVAKPDSIHMLFLGFIELSGHSVVLAALVALSQVAYTRLAMGPRVKPKASGASFSEDMAASFDLQARYVLPVIIGVVSVSVAAAAPLYWLTSNLAMLVQEYLAGRRF